MSCNENNYKIKSYFARSAFVPAYFSVSPLARLGHRGSTELLVHLLHTRCP